MQDTIKIKWRKCGHHSYAAGVNEWELRITQQQSGQWYFCWFLNENWPPDGVLLDSLSEAKHEAELIAEEMQDPKFLKQYGYQPEDV